jgi:hypothetical protein
MFFDDMLEFLPNVKPWNSDRFGYRILKKMLFNLPWDCFGRAHFSMVRAHFSGAEL